MNVGREQGRRMRPSALTRGCMIAVVPLLMGLLLQWLIGEVKWSAFSSPVNFFVLLALLAVLFVAHVLRRRVALFRFLSSTAAAIPALVSTVVLTLMMGLTRQDGDGGWFSSMLTCWSFVLTYLYLTIILGMTTLRRLSGMVASCCSVVHHDVTPRHNAPRRWTAEVAFLLNHAGLLVTIVCATLGSADMQRVKMLTAEHTVQWRAIDQQRHVKEMPVGIALKRCILETYDNGAPRRFASEIDVVTRTGKRIQTTVDVNQPVEVEGWKIYQFDYDTDPLSGQTLSVLELVRDPWWPAVMAGIVMMMAGALMMFLMHPVQRL